MKIKRRISITILLIVLLSLGWWCLYTKVNSYYADFSDLSTEHYSIGETVEFGEDYLGINLSANGYTLKVDSFEIVDYSEYIQNQEIADVAEKEDVRPEKLALVYITVSNIDSSADGIMLTELKLHGIDQNAFLDWTVMDAINPVLSGNLGIALSQGTQYQLILPYRLRQRDFSSAWDNLDSYQFFLQITSFPTVKEIQVQ